MPVDRKLLFITILAGGALSLIQATPEVDYCRNCDEGEFVAVPCDVSAGKHRECKPCSERCGKGVMECHGDGKGDALCKECNFDTAGDMYLSKHDLGGFGYCKFCSQCREGTYLKTPCVDFLDNVCEDCTECHEDEVEVSPCTDKFDRKCGPKGNLNPEQDYFVAWGEFEACVSDPNIKDLKALRNYLTNDFSPSGEGETLWDMIHAEQRAVVTPVDVLDTVQNIYWPTHREDIPAVSKKCAKGGPRGCCCKALAEWRLEVRMEQKSHATGLIHALNSLKSENNVCIGLASSGVIKEHVDETGQLVQSNNSKKPSAGKVIGYMILTILMVAIIVGGFFAWQQRDKFEEYLPERWKKAERLQDQAQLPESTTPEKGNGLCFDSDNIAQQHQSASAACEEGHFKSLDIEESGDTSINVKVVEKDLGPDKGSNTDPQ